MTTTTNITRELLDQLLANYTRPEDLTGDDGLFKQLKALIERALGAELTEHLGDEKGDPAGRGRGNCRKGTSSKTVLTEDRVRRRRPLLLRLCVVDRGAGRFDVRVRSLARITSKETMTHGFNWQCGSTATDRGPFIRLGSRRTIC
jgi:putative transposase